jgi:hypothetical protein
MKEKELNLNIRDSYELGIADGYIDASFWEGYRRGLRRKFYGEEFGTEEEHIKWMDSANNDEKNIRERGLGYRAGHAGKDAKKLGSTRKKLRKKK